MKNWMYWIILRLIFILLYVLMNYVIKKSIITRVLSLLWFISSFLFILFIGKVFAVLDFTNDNTVWYIKDLFFTNDSKSPTSTNTKIIVKWSDWSMTLSWNLNIWKWMLSDSSVLWEDIKDWNIINSIFGDNSISSTKIKNNTILSNSIATSWVESIDIKDWVLNNNQFDSNDKYYFQFFKDHTNSWYMIDLNSNSLLLSTITNNLLINNARTDKLTVWWDIPWNYNVEINWNWMVEWKLCSNNACWWDKPKEIWVMNNSMRCKGDWNAIQCNGKVIWEGSRVQF